MNFFASRFNTSDCTVGKLWGRIIDKFSKSFFTGPINAKESKLQYRQRFQIKIRKKYEKKRQVEVTIKNKLI